MLTSRQIIAIFLPSDLLWRLTDMVSVWDKLFSFVQDQGTNLSGTKAPAALFTPGWYAKKAYRLSQACVWCSWRIVPRSGAHSVYTDRVPFTEWPVSGSGAYKHIYEMVSYAGGIRPTECWD